VLVYPAPYDLGRVLRPERCGDLLSDLLQCPL